MEIEDTRKCPFCAEIIKSEAIKCKHCYSDLTKVANPESTHVNNDKENTKWLCNICGEESDIYSDTCWKCHATKIVVQQIKVKSKKLIDEVLISVSESLEIAKEYGIPVTRPTAITWIKKNKLGYQPGKEKTSHWVVNKLKWTDFILGRN